MDSNIEELDYQKTHMGELILRRRKMLSLDNLVIYEVKLGEEFLMSSLFHVAEVALARMGLERLTGDNWDIVVGGLGLGYTAAAALEYSQLKRLVVVEALKPVIDWHEQTLVPNGQRLKEDKRCIYHHTDFFACSRDSGFDPVEKNYRFDAILLDIDHTPDYLLNTSHGDFYTPAGLEQLKAFIKPNGVFALWSNDPPQDAFLDIMSAVFKKVEGHLVSFDNPVTGGQSTNGIYIGMV